MSIQRQIYALARKTLQEELNAVYKAQKENERFKMFVVANKEKYSELIISAWKKSYVQAGKKFNQQAHELQLKLKVVNKLYRYSE